MFGGSKLIDSYNTFKKSITKDITKSITKSITKDNLKDNIREQTKNIIPIKYTHKQWADYIEKMYFT